MMYESTLSAHRLTRVLPHIIDTLFLVSAVWLAVMIRQYPFTDAWLTAKIFWIAHLHRAWIICPETGSNRARTDHGVLWRLAGFCLDCLGGPNEDSLGVSLVPELKPETCVPTIVLSMITKVKWPPAKRGL